jgi:hypothetical protein
MVMVLLPPACLLAGGRAWWELSLSVVAVVAVAVESSSEVVEELNFPAE